MDSNNKTARKRNPVIKANPISELLYCYMIPIFWRNYKNSLKEEDLYAVLDEDKASWLGDTLEDAWKRAHKSHPKYALHVALLKVHGLKFALAGILRYTGELVLLVVLPFSIRKLVKYFERGPPLVTENEAYIYTGAILATLLLNAIISHSVMLYLMHMSMKMRVACCSLIYRKALRLSLTLGETTIGQAVNLVSNDVRKIDTGLVSTHFIWIAPLQVVVGTYLLYQVIGISAFCGMGFLLLFVPLQFYLGKYNSVIRLRTAIRTDERVRLMNEILSGIQVIKMYTWEKPFAKLISLARRFEIKQTRIHYYIESVIYGLTMFVPRTAIFISIVVYVYLGNNITAETAFTITAIYGTLRITVSLIFSLGIIGTANIHISLLRLQEFLSCSELPNLTNKYLEIKKLEKDMVIDKVVKNNEIFAPPKITFKGVYAKWIPTGSDYNLIDINLNIEDKKLIAVIGAVGSGKSTLLNAILKEVSISSGYIDVNGTVSYASQEPWLFTASVRHNILFGNEYDEERYRYVVRVCALESDFKMFPNGDLTVVSERGKSLSGGQKARINLARCVYKQADIYLLDDPLSAVDTKVGKELYTNCIQKFLSDKICILITHQLQYLKTADQIIIMEEGKIVAEDQFDTLQHSDLNFAKLLKQFNNEEEENPEVKAVKSRQSSITENEEDDEEVIDNKETVTTGSISIETYTTYFRAGGSIFTMILLIFIIVAVHAVGRGGDYFVSYWVNLEQASHYENHSSNFTLDRDSIIYTYSGIILATIVLGLVCPVFFFIFFMRASVNIHDAIFNKISYSTMEFFNDNPIGRILNRFSKDMGIIDDYIPPILLDVFDISFVFFGAMILICIVNVYLLLPTTILVFIFFLVRTFYMHTSRSVKRIEGITRTPIFNHLVTTMNGLSTIRAFNAEKTLSKEFDVHQDLHSSSWHLFLSSNRAFGFFLDVICIIFIGVITCSFLLLNKGYYGGDIGLVITQMIYLSGLLQWGMRQWAELENNMTSVERVLEYTKQETEPVRKPIANLPNNWPEFGKIVFENVSMKYKPVDAPVLKNLNFTIRPCEKIGIVGRTGAGKSSTITALFQLYNLEGSIIIDDIDTTLLPLEILRPKISIIPQEPVLFSGTLRKNLDPFEEYDDKTLWYALEQVELKDAIEDSPGGLSSNVSESGANFSIGQRQLICLARALIRNNKILVMDEATANVDPHTDSLIQKTIRKCFANCTVLTIAHRLHTIMDSDRVLVMDHGKVAEFDHPHNLLQKTKGIFYSMVQTTGTAAAQKLTSIAEESFLK